LGNGKISNSKRIFKNFNDARSIVRTLGFKSVSEWKNYCTSGQKPLDIPSNPNTTYKNKGWVDFNDWLGSNQISTKNIIWLPFDKARNYVHKLKLKSEKEWKVYCKSGSKPANIPYDPKQVYKNSGYVNFGDWLGSGNQASGSLEYLSFEKAREIVRELKIETTSKWKEFVKSGQLPLNIPKAPHYYYRDKGWSSYGDWLGSGMVAPQNRKYLEYEIAKEKIRNLNLKSRSDFFRR
jgi:hypothetical protein